MKKKQPDEADVKSLQTAVAGLHDCEATVMGREEVSETFHGQTVWEGVVHIFRLIGHLSAETCYCWSSPVEGSDRRRFYAILKEPPISSAADAVCASIVADYKAGKGR